MGMSLANYAGIDPKYGHHLDKEIVAFPVNSELTVVNVDVISKAGILRAKKLGLVASKKADIIVTPNMMYAAEQLFDKEHKGRMMAVFRHPVQRVVSLFYYLQVADWEPGYNPKLKETTLLEWATKHPESPNHLLRHLANKPKGKIDERDVERAVHLLERRVVVGLTERMEESVHRFNRVLGLDEVGDERVQGCMEEYFPSSEDAVEVAQTDKDWTIKQRSHHDTETNKNHHPNYDETSPEWKLLAEQHKYDILLFENIVRIFDDQKKLFDP